MRAGRTGELRTGLARVLLCAGVLVALLTGLLRAAEADAQGRGAPDLDARAWILVDARTGERLAGKAADRQLPIASATKLMTAYLALRELPLNRTVTAPRYDANPVESVLGLQAGETISVRDLLVAMMLPSANDAAFALAEEVAGSVPKFVKRMNRAAERLGLDDTSYANPIGLDDPLNGSSARDLAALTLALREDERFKKIVSKPGATLKSASGKPQVETRNTLLLGDDSIDGVKTGRTQGAGFVLVASAKRKGVPLVSAVLGTGSEADRDNESARLLDYGFSLYKPRVAVRRGEIVGTAAVKGEAEDLDLTARRGGRVVARRDQRVSLRLAAPAEVDGPIEAGQRLGRAAILVDGERTGFVPVVAGRAVAAPTILDQAGSAVTFFLIGGGLILVVGALIVGMRRTRTEPEEAPGRTAEERRRSHKRRARRRKQEGNET